MVKGHSGSSTYVMSLWRQVARIAPSIQEVECERKRDSIVKVLLMK